MSLKILKKREEQLINWKEKAKCRRVALSEYRKEIKRLRQSRNEWREKYKAQKHNGINERRAESLVSNQCYIKINSEKVRNHSYDSFVIFCALQIRDAGTVSLRSCLKVLVLMKCVFQLNFKLPCINTIRNWEDKKGYVQLHHNMDTESEYALIIDESFCVGKQVILLILAVNLTTYHWNSALNYEDVEVLSIQVKPYWKSEDIRQLLEGLLKNQYNIRYCVSDGGNNIVKALRTSNLERVEDCTHALSKLIEKRYKEDRRFKAFCFECGRLHKRCYMSSIAMICPPKLGIKSRFLNLYELARWGEKNLSLLEVLDKEKNKNDEQCKIYQYLQWLEEYRDLIQELRILTKLLKCCFEVLKNKGLSISTQQALTKIITKDEVPVFFKQGIEKYLARNTKLLDNHARLICCSDIIESYFGKYKQQRRLEQKKTISSTCLKIAGYGKIYREENIASMIGGVNLHQIDTWKKENLMRSIASKKKELYKKCG